MTSKVGTCDLAPDGWYCSRIDERRGDVLAVIREAMAEWDGDRGPQDEWIASRLSGVAPSPDILREAAKAVIRESSFKEDGTPGTYPSVAAIIALRDALNMEE